VSTPEIFRPEVGVSLGDILYRVQRLEAWAPSIDAQFNIKVTADNTFFIVGDDKFVWMIPADLDTWELTAAEAYVSTVGTTETVVQVRNRTTGEDMLTVPLTISAGVFTTCDSSPAVEISDTWDDVSACDMIAIDIDTAAPDAKGLGVILTFTKPFLRIEA
jgi:hypothetical protein